MAATLKDAFFWWVSKNIEPAVTTLIEDKTMSKQETLAALTELQTQAAKFSEALAADEQRDAVVHKLFVDMNAKLADLSAKVESEADSTEVLALVRDIQGHVTDAASRLNVLDPDAAAPADGGVVTGDTLPQ